METEEMIKIVDGIYKNILEKFNPGARQLISAGKAYLKALHGAAAASRLFNETLAKIAFNAQQTGTTDIGAALMNIVNVYKEIQDQHMNILKAFYVDLLVPLETNLEKDTKVIQFEQKKFLQQHKIRADSYSKAANTLKKQKRKKNNSQSAEKEIKNMQIMEDEKNKLDRFCEDSLKIALTQERRRYGFVLERQCSLAKHWLAYHSAGKTQIEISLENWNGVAASREFLPPNVENMYKRELSDNVSDSCSSSDRSSFSSQLRKTHSIDASCLDVRSMGDFVTNSMNRTKSEHNLTTNTNLLCRNNINEEKTYDNRPIAKALYAYLSSGENQLSFFEGDRIALVGDKANGWQFGENLRTQLFGWFPMAYTENDENNIIPCTQNTTNFSQLPNENLSSRESLVFENCSTKPKLNNSYQYDPSQSLKSDSKFMYHSSKNYDKVNDTLNPKPGPPPALPAPVPFYAKNKSIQNNSSDDLINENKNNEQTLRSSNKTISNKEKSGKVYGNDRQRMSKQYTVEPPPQPEVDYSDEEFISHDPVRLRKDERMSELKYGHSQKIDSSTLKQKSISKPKKTNIPRPSSSYDNLTSEHSNEYFNKNNDTLTLKLMNQNKNETLTKNIKRSKSFWKFRKNDEEILEGMSLWKHRDLVQTEDEQPKISKKVTTLKKPTRNIDHNNTHEKDNMNTKSSSSRRDSFKMNDIDMNSSKLKYSDSISSNETIKNNQIPNNIDNQVIKYPITKSDIDNRISKVNEENVYGSQSLQMQREISSKNKMYVVNNNNNNYNNNHNNNNNYYNNNNINNNNSSSIDNINDIDKHKYSNNRNIEDIRNNINVRTRHSRDHEDDSIQSIDRSNHKKKMSKNKHKNDKNNYYDDESEIIVDDASLLNNNSVQLTNFFDEDCDKDIMLMKTVKRKEILKQYYSSGTDTEQNSTSSDQYDFILIDDHLVHKDELNRNNKNKYSLNEHNDSIRRNQNKMEFSTFRTDTNKKSETTTQSDTLLPRTRLSKLGNSEPQNNLTSTDLDVNSKKKKDEKLPRQKKTNLKTKYINVNDNNMNNNKTYGPWYDLWGDDIPPVGSNK